MNQLSKYVFFLCLLTSFQMKAQVNDSFDDGEILMAPEWQGDVDRFIVEAGVLRLDDTTGRSSEIYTEFTLFENNVWDLWINLDFAPSSSNSLEIGLFVDSPSDPQHALSVEIGESGDTDRLSFFQTSDGEKQMIGETSEGTMGQDPAIVHLRIEQSGTQWMVLTDYTGGNDLTEDFTVELPAPLSGSCGYFSLKCNYTSTRSKLFFFDNIDIQVSGSTDDQAPKWITLETLDENTLNLKFDEAPEAMIVDMLDLFEVEGIGNPISILQNENCLELNFAGSFVSGQEYSLSIEGIIDCVGNSSEKESRNFTFIELVAPDYGDLRITEIFADPTPIIELPDYEWVELLNLSDKYLDLSTVTLTIGFTDINLPAYTLNPGEYITICDDGGADELGQYAEVLAVSSFSSITNGGEPIEISSQGQLDAVDWNLQWYQDEEKAGGGWSLEIIDPYDFCATMENWRASENNSLAASPSEQNSVFDTLSESMLSVNQIQATEADEILVSFNRRLSLQAEDVAKYNLLPDLEIIEAVVNENEVRLTLSSALDSGTVYELIISEIFDCSSESSYPGGLFEILLPDRAQQGDVRITEFMADPSPSVALPQAEFIEISNFTSKTFDLSDFELTVGTSDQTLPYYLLGPFERVIVCDIEDVEAFLVFGNVLPLVDFSSITDSGESLGLTSSGSEDFIPWDKSWYRDGDKVSGGWSLELVNPQNLCALESNWRESNDPRGGTPGQENSVHSDESIHLNFLKLSLNTPSSLLVDFDGLLNADAVDISDFNFISGRVINSAVIGFDPSTVFLTFSPEIAIGEMDELEIFMELEDCAGNNLGIDTTAVIAIGHAPEKGELLINELLFQPFSGGADFIELVNSSDRILSTRDVYIRNPLLTSDPKEELIDPVSFILPGELIVFTEVPKKVNSKYEVPKPQNLLFQELPSFNSDGGNASIIHRIAGIETILDSFDYSPALHHVLLDSDGFRGVSLERASTELSTNTPSNWHSAAATVGFATPTGENSQKTNLNEESSEFVSFTNKVFSPDRDGYKDFLLIHIEDAFAGSIANIRIYDSEGRLAKRLANNLLVANNETLKWDGFDDQDLLALPGIYIVYVELYEPDGRVRKHKATCILAKLLN